MKPDTETILANAIREAVLKTSLPREQWINVAFSMKIKKDVVRVIGMDIREEPRVRGK